MSYDSVNVSFVSVRPDKFTGTCGNFSKFARYYQFDEFYKREIAIWKNNKDYKGIPVRTYLFENRLKYLGKTPDQLTDTEILRGLTISGVLKAYTVFDASLMQEVIRKYNIKSVYDPCAGWGERLLCCHKNNVRYEGVDINNALVKGYNAMISDMKIQNCSFVNADSSDYHAPVGYEAVITCPPYHNFEHYTDVGAENLSYEDFLLWWDKVVKHSVTETTKYFCFQINQKYKKDMADIVERNGFTLVDEFKYKTNRSSHFTRKSGKNTKTEYEVMLVFKVADGA
jgi:hypothetical protein